MNNDDDDDDFGPIRGSINALAITIAAATLAALVWAAFNL